MPVSFCRSTETQPRRARLSPLGWIWGRPSGARLQSEAERSPGEPAGFLGGVEPRM